MKNEESGEICDDYNGEDYCGAEPVRIHYMAMKCEGKETDIMNCYRELADGCEHIKDFIVECVNVDYDKPVEPDKGTIRLLDDKGAPAKKGKGRLEMFRK